MDAPKNVSHVSAPREMRHETDAPDPGTALETTRETATTKLLIAKVLARSQVRQPVRQPVRQGFEPVRQPVRQPPENLTSRRDCSQGEQVGASVVPAHIRAALELGGYERDLTEWTPGACQRFLNQLKAEWPAFKVNGWHGLKMPDNFPVEFRDAVQSAYVLALQGGDE